jgi:ribonuclease HI
MIVTVNTDASFSNKYKVGSYAFWVVCDEYKFKSSGMLKQQVANSTLSEMRCICNALSLLAKKRKTTEGATTKMIHHVIVNTDSLNAIHVFTDDKERMHHYHLTNKKYQSITKVYNKIKKDNYTGVKMEFRHVKAHRDTKTGRTWVNDWCDKECKKHMAKFYDLKNTESKV